MVCGKSAQEVRRIESTKRSDINVKALLAKYRGINEESGVRLKWNICAFLLPTYPKFFLTLYTLNNKMVFGEKMGTFSISVTIFFVKCYNKINNFPTYLP